MSNPLVQAVKGIMSGGNYKVTPRYGGSATPKKPSQPTGHFMNSAPQKGGNGKAQPDPGGDLSHWTPPFAVKSVKGATKRYAK